MMHIIFGNESDFDGNTYKRDIEKLVSLYKNTINEQYEHDFSTIVVKVMSEDILDYIRKTCIENGIDGACVVVTKKGEEPYTLYGVP